MLLEKYHYQRDLIDIHKYYNIFNNNLIIIILLFYDILCILSFIYSEKTLKIISYFTLFLFLIIQKRILHYYRKSNKITSEICVYYPLLYAYNIILHIAAIFLVVLGIYFITESKIDNILMTLLIINLVIPFIVGILIKYIIKNKHTRPMTEIEDKILLNMSKHHNPYNSDLLCGLHIEKPLLIDFINKDTLPENEESIIICDTCKCYENHKIILYLECGHRVHKDCNNNEKCESCETCFI